MKKIILFYTYPYRGAAMIPRARIGIITTQHDAVVEILKTVDKMGSHEEVFPRVTLALKVVTETEVVEICSHL